MQKKIFNLNTFTIKTLFLLVIMMLVGCLPLQKNTECGDNEAFDPERRKCVPTLGATTSSTVFISNKVPENSYTTTVSTGSVNHSIAVSDAFSFGFSTKWILHFSGENSIVNGQELATNTLSFTVDPSALLGVGSYVLEAIVFDEDGTTQIDSVTWSISITGLAPPKLTSPNPATSAFTYTSESNSETLSLVIDNTDNQSGSFSWFLDGVSVDSGNFTSATNSLSQTIDPSSMTQGIHTLELELNDGAGNVFDSYTWTLIITDPDLPVISQTTPNHLDAITVVNGISFASSGYLDSTGTALAQICVTVDDYDKVTTGVSDVDVEFSINGNIEDAGTFTANQYCASTFSTQNLSNDDIGESKTLTIKVLRAGTNTIIDFRQISLSIRPKNLRPSISIDSADSTIECVTEVSSSSFTGCTMTQSVNIDQDTEATSDYSTAGDIDNNKTFAITISDDDISDYNVDSDYSVSFELKKATDASYNILDGTNAYSTVTCQSTLGDGEANYDNRRTCTLHMDAFNSNGPIAPGVYILKAYASDNGSVYDIGNVKESNSVTWEITVTEYQSNSISILSQDLDGTDVNGSDGTNPLSWVEAALDSTCAPTNTLINTGTSTFESNYIIVHTKVQDNERDSFEISIEMENNEADSSGNSFTQVIPRSTVTRTDDNKTHEVESCFQIPQWTVSGAAIDTVDIKVSIIDSPDSQDAQSDTEDFNILVNNVNPPPAFADGTDVDKSSDYVIAGYPYTISPPSFSDTSLTDGEVVSWQWQVSVDDAASWTNIVGADSVNMSDASLIWTPDTHTQVADGNLHLRLCLGDDGFGNDLADCNVNKEYQNINVRKSVYNINQTTDPSGNNLASWYDSRDEILYTAYTKNNSIHVEKFTTNSTSGELEFDSSISFDTESPGNQAVPAYDLSMDGYNDGGSDGDDKSLLIAYRVNTSATSTPELRVRRIYIDNSKMSFHYLGLYNDANQASDLFDTTDDGSCFTIAEGANPEETTITIIDNTQCTNADTITLNTHTFTYGTDFCSTPADCDTEEEVAIAIESLITNSVVDKVSKTLTASVAGTVVTIKGFPRDDYYDNNSKITPVVGQIKVIGTQWFLPFADTFNNLKLSIEKGSNANQHKDNWTPTSTLTSSGDFNQEIANTVTPNGNLAIATKGSSGNIDLYVYNSSTALQGSDLNVFNLNGFIDINNISISSSTESSSGSNDPLIWISAISTSDTSETHLSLATYNESSLQSVATTSFVQFNNDLTENLDQAKVVARTGHAQEVIVAISTDTNNTYQNSIRLLKFNIDDYTTFPTSNIDLKDYISPAFNENNTYLTGKIWTTPIFTDLVKGSVGDTANENTKDTLFYLWHEIDSGNKVIKAGMLNIEEENITSSTPISGSGQANIAP